MAVEAQRGDASSGRLLLRPRLDRRSVGRATVRVRLQGGGDTLGPPQPQHGDSDSAAAVRAPHASRGGQQYSERERECAVCGV